MKKPRWRTFLRVMRPHAIKLMDMQDHHELVSAILYIAFLSGKEEMTGLTTLHHYANLVDSLESVFPHKINNI